MANFYGFLLVVLNLLLRQVLQLWNLFENHPEKYGWNFWELLRLQRFLTVLSSFYLNFQYSIGSIIFQTNLDSWDYLICFTFLEDTSGSNLPSILGSKNWCYSMELKVLNPVIETSLNWDRLKGVADMQISKRDVNIRYHSKNMARTFLFDKMLCKISYHFSFLVQV